MILRNHRPVTATTIHSIVGNQALQMALLNCAVELVLGTFSATMSFPALTAELGQLPAVLDIWAAAAHFKQCLSSGTHTDMPHELEEILGYMRYKFLKQAFSVYHSFAISERNNFLY